jgi:hypothetical protein
MINEWDASFVLWICGAVLACQPKQACSNVPMQYNKRAKRIHPYWIYTVAYSLGGVPSNLSFIERIPQCIELYLANQGGMGADLSHNPYVSGNFEAPAPPKLSTQDPEYLGWLDSPWRVVAGVGACRMQPPTDCWVAFLRALPGRGAVTQLSLQFLCPWNRASVGCQQATR